MLSERLQQLPPPLAQEGSSPVAPRDGQWGRQASGALAADDAEVCLTHVLRCLDAPRASAHALDTGWLHVAKTCTVVRSRLAVAQPVKRAVAAAGCAGLAASKFYQCECSVLFVLFSCKPRTPSTW